MLFSKIFHGKFPIILAVAKHVFFQTVQFGTRPLAVYLTLALNHTLFN